VEQELQAMGLTVDKAGLAENKAVLTTEHINPVMATAVATAV
jgi:hypothetical protein